MLPPKVYTFLCGCFAAMGAMLYGYDLGVISYVLVAPDFLKTIDTTDENYIGFITSSMLLGAFVGSIPASLIADAFSRRMAITVAGVVFIVGGVLQTAAQNKETMFAGRFFAGIGIGMLGLLAPLYQSEIAHPSARGMLTATFQFFLGIGSFLAGWIAYGVAQTHREEPMAWRLPLGFQMLPAVPLIFLTFLLPESPRWLIIKGHDSKALRSLARLHAQGDESDAFVLGEFTAIKDKVEAEAVMQQSWRLIFNFQDRTNMRKVLYGIILQFSVQMTGVSAIQYYAPSVYASVGFSTHTSLLINSINSVNALIAQFCCILFVDKVGRRLPLIFGNILSGTCFAVATALAKQFSDGKGSRGQGIGFVIVIYIYNFFFSSCIGPLSWIYPVEIMNTAIRAKATAMVNMAAWISNFMIGQVSPKAFADIGWKYYLVFCVCSFTNAITFYLFFPETRGRTLEEMDMYFREMNLIVPLTKGVGRIDVKERERELADRGIDQQQGDGKDEKKEIEHHELA
ncbi:glucose transporter [Cryptococcus wingfieldii CBS 7118]|uniref:Glucose transporter n=1 Tax=Cryptococcus wingfieldii CBS 7118 TaxID=1295528 RepID=A0A1E3ICV2_9TREE|nr:glucose transporter [Cryptococcus wingfieldii CBS 7118]ODN86318.1 glucose transporter [Cryptococcus wingfieldii CBS 7118]